MVFISIYPFHVLIPDQNHHNKYLHFPICISHNHAADLKSIDQCTDPDFEKNQFHTHLLDRLSKILHICLRPSTHGHHNHLLYSISMLQYMNPVLFHTRDHDLTSFLWKIILNRIPHWSNCKYLYRVLSH